MKGMKKIAMTAPVLFNYVLEDFMTMILWFPKEN